LVKPLSDVLNYYAPIGQTVGQLAPTPAPASLVLGGVTCIMSISSRFLDFQEKIAETLTEMGDKLEILQQYEKYVYHTDEQIQSAPTDIHGQVQSALTGIYGQVQSALIDIYGDILDFCTQSARLLVDDKGLPKSTSRTFRKSLRKSFKDELGSIVKKFHYDFDRFKGRAEVCKERKEDPARRLQSEIYHQMSHQMLQQTQDSQKMYTSLFFAAQNMQGQSGQQMMAENRRRGEDARIRKGLYLLPWETHLLTQPKRRNDEKSLIGFLQFLLMLNSLKSLT
jgi:hypothetical protein